MSAEKNTNKMPAGLIKKPADMPTTDAKPLRCIVPSRKMSEAELDALEAGLHEDPLTPVRPQIDGCPLARNRDGYWFWDEVWAWAHGPYASEDDAQAALTAYAQTL